MKKVTLSDGRSVEVECLSCAIVDNTVPPTGGTIYETEYFHAHQDVAYPIKGLVILASKRHIKSIDEMSEAERYDYIDCVAKIRQSQRQILDIDHVYYFYNEDTTHHFHTWMVPRYNWMSEFGRSVESLRPVLLHARNNMNDKNNIKEVRLAIEKLKANLLQPHDFNNVTIVFFLI